MCSIMVVIIISVKTAGAGEPENKSITPKEFVTTVSEVPGKVGNFLTNEVEKTKEYQKKSWAEMKTKWPFTMFNKKD